MPPPELIEFRNELAKPNNRDIYDKAIAEPSFEDAIGQVAACLDIALDGMYDVPDLCKLLTKALVARGTLGNSPTQLDNRLVSAGIVERENELSLERMGEVQAPLTAKELEIRQHNKFMEEHGCKICDHRTLCREANKCLGNTPEVLKDATPND